MTQYQMTEHPDITCKNRKRFNLVMPFIKPKSMAQTKQNLIIQGLEYLWYEVQAVDYVILYHDRKRGLSLI